MLTRKSIDTVLLSVGAEKLSQREWDWMKMLKPMDPPPAMVTTSILKRRGDTAALTLLQDTGGLIHPHVVRFYSPPSETVCSQPTSAGRPSRMRAVCAISRLKPSPKCWPAAHGYWV